MNRPLHKLMDKQVLWFAKVGIGLVACFALSASDFVPDLVPAFGHHDNLVLPGETTVSTVSWKNRRVVRTQFGQIRGVNGKGNTWSWKGIPFASPPIGWLRWKAPVDPKPWTGIRSGRNFGKSSSQILPVVGLYGSEDCLFLNIWRPKGTNSKLPVYFFIHGGGNSLGTPVLPDYYGYSVAGKSKMLYVSVNYRLSVLGWFRHPAVTASDSPADRSGNFGTLDQIKALEWVRDNIAAFGGDPDNVTIAGESAGAMNVLSLMTSPLAKGLFHRAIAESGIVIMETTADAEKASSNLLASLLLADNRVTDLEAGGRMAANMSNLDIDTYFRSKTPAQLMEHIPMEVVSMLKWPSIYTDGSVLPEEGYQVFTSGNWANKVPLLIGVNKDEAKYFRWYQKVLEPGSGRYEIMSRYQSLFWRIVGLDSVALAITTHPDSPPVFAYRFDWGSPDSFGVSVLPKKMGAYLGAYHHAEIPFFLGTGISDLTVITGIAFTKENRPGRKLLTDLCMAYLANFAKTGNPNGSDLPVWKPWNPAPGSNKLMILDAGFSGLRLSASEDIVTFKSLVSQIKAELKEPDRGEILKIVMGPSPLGIVK